MKTPPFDVGRILSAVLFIVVLSWVLACVDPNSKPGIHSTEWSSRGTGM
jgi:hypothetical protein